MSDLERVWRKCKLDELGSVGRGKSKHRPRNDPSLYDGKYPFVQTGDIKEAEFHLTKYSQTYNEKGLAQSKLWEPGTLCITIAANIADTAILGIPACFPDSVVGFVANQNKADVRFIKYSIDTLKLEMQGVSRGTTQDNLSLDKLLSFDFRVPTLTIQHRIADILSAYDDLIENNQRRIQILENMARALYREWFVEFRFPGHENVKFVDSPLGKIPEGWSSSTLGTESHVVMGQSPKSEFYNESGEGLPFHQGVSHFGNHFPAHIKHCSLESRIAEAGDALVSVRAPVGRINIADTRLIIGRGLSAVRSKNQPPGFHYWQLREVFREEDAMGGGTIFKAITKNDLLDIPWLVPEQQIVESFDLVERPMFDLLSNLTRKTANLRRTRDLLLPRLLSGQLDVSTLPEETIP